MTAAEMKDGIAEASPRLRTRITGVVYLLYFLTAVSSEAFVGRGRPVLYDVVNLIAYAFYIAVTLLFYYMFTPVNRSLSLLAAFFSLVGLAFEALRLQPRGMNVAIVFAGLYCLLIASFSGRPLCLEFWAP
jgi:hypothetical protein